MKDTPTPWPYPRWIAHRGAGKLAPENTLAAFRLGAQHGYRMAECDAKLSADGQVFLLHDDTLDRTTDGQGIAGYLPWAELSLRDADTDPAVALKTLKQITEQLVVRTPGYRCQRCGFGARAHHWQCPGCKSWGSIKPVHGAVSE